MHSILVATAAFAVALSSAAAPGQTNRIVLADGGQQGHGIMAQHTMSADSSYQLGDLMIENPWSRATAGRAGGAFMMIHNAGDRSDRLIAARTDVAGLVQLHMTLVEDGVMKMRQVEGGIEVPADGMAELKPGGFHVMMMGLTGPLEEGASFPVTLTFEQAGAVTIDVRVQAAGAMDAGMHHSN